ncbi:ATP-dependent helicase HrpA [Thiohalobacter thiocyanaticus]|uniref:RNA helicase n=2 Tax=Thiohalobacter thiocyanaticus TaxID=585455 RepID=A0A1Z4VU49_9GAMM|nr:ATP-dependent helicase HrpA [Thiohalobacter thiocyanaticus]
MAGLLIPVCMSVSELKQLEQRLARCLLRDRPALHKRLAGLRRRLRSNKPIDRGLSAVAAEISASEQRREQRRRSLPRPEYPLELPVVEHREAIAAALTEHQVVIVCGETGSGKTTQLPKICLELGRGVDGLIGHTQPRRIAARSLAARIAEELHTEVGAQVGFKVRFSDRVGADSLIKVMTDGILLAETRSDPQLLAYDTLIIDEAHERSLNVDFLLGYLKRLLPQRPELKVIITSATIDPERFSRHFDDAPIIEVSGRTYPVELRYRPLRGEDEDSRERDRGEAILDAVDELARAGPGDILVFLPGERDIRDAAERLRKHHPPQTEILPLYGRLSVQQQQQVFRAHSGRRIVLATNVAETSLTVPGIRYVVDTGLARISRYSHRTKVQRLPIEPVAQASADQRAGRCGRVAPGICIRLYSEEDYAQRPVFTDPEIRRTSLASVILQMLQLGLGDIEAFPFIDPPDPRYVRDGFRLLHELQAIDDDSRLTDIGRKLARLPLDVRLGRMLLAAHAEGSLEEVLVIVSALTVPDPRLRPLEAQQAADEAQAAFRDEQSDFVGFLKLWRFYREQERHLTRRKLQRLCERHYLSWVRLREWKDIHGQLLGLVRELDLQFNAEPAEHGAIHRALLSGLLGNLAFKGEGQEYTGARGIKLHIFPGSGLFRKPPKWIMAAELVETGRQYARTVARIEPQWAEQLAPHLVKRNWRDAHWEQKRGRAVADEQVSLYGLVLVPARRVDYSRVDPQAARELFIRGALVRGEYRTRLEFHQHNRSLIEEVEELEAKSRRQDILIDEAVLYDYFDRLVPADVSNAPEFERWYKRATPEQQQAFHLSRETLMQHAAGHITGEAFPARLELGGLSLALHYHFEPGHAEDGVTLEIPLAALNQLSPEPFEWLVPGLLEEKATALIRSLPKALRRHFVPAPDFARACLQALSPGEGSLTEQLAAQLRRMTGIEVGPDDWRLEQLPLHLFMNFRVLDGKGKCLAQGRDLAALKAGIGARAERSFAGLPTAEYERAGIMEWDVGDLPESIELERDGLRLRGYPALVAEDDGVALRLLDNPERARRAHRAGTLALFCRQADKTRRYLEKNLPQAKQLCLHYAPVGDCDSLKRDIIRAAAAECLFAEQEELRTQQDYARARQAAEARLVETANRLAGEVGAALARHHAIARRLKGKVPPQWLGALNDIRDQLQYLVYPGFVAATPRAWLGELPRYLQAVERRLDRLESNPGRDRQLAAQVAPHWEACKARLQTQGPASDALQHFRWLVEEFRVSLFAQELGTREKVSDQRLQKVRQALS